MEIWIFLIGFIRLFDLERSMKTHCCFCNVIKRFLGQSRDDFLPLYFPFRQSRLQMYLGISYLVLRRKDSMVFSYFFFQFSKETLLKKFKYYQVSVMWNYRFFFWFLSFTILTGFSSPIVICLSIVHCCSSDIPQNNLFLYNNITV